MSPGIPPSLDRQEQQLKVIASSVVLLACFLLVLFLTVTRPTSPLPDSAVDDSRTDDQRLRDYLAEEERASAYKALRDHLDQRKSEPHIDAVFCRDSFHRWVGDTIEFQGDVDFERPNGALERHHYLAILRGSEQDGWEVVSVEVNPGER